MFNTASLVFFRMEYCIYTLDLKNIDTKFDSCINNLFYIFNCYINYKILLNSNNCRLLKNLRLEVKKSCQHQEKCFEVL